MERILTVTALKKINQKILIKGWVNAVREHGKITFFDLRDR